MVVMDIERTREEPGGIPWSHRAPAPAAVPAPGRALRPAPTVVPIPFGADVPEWMPLAGPALLERLRHTGRPRLHPDPCLVARLRGWLEQAAGSDLAGEPLVVTKDRLTQALACESHAADSQFAHRPPTVALACGALMGVLFRQLVTVGAIDDPMADGLAALSVDDRQGDLVSWIAQLGGPERDELAGEVERQAEGLGRRWPSLEPAWLPRTHQSVRAGLAGGAVELSARVDLAIGRPLPHKASVALVEVKSGARRPEHRDDRHFDALVEAVRSPAPPFVVATYYTRTGELDVDPVSPELLVESARRTAVGISRMRQLAEGAPSRPGDRCSWCALQSDCPPDEQPRRSPRFGCSSPPGDR
jgi:hypothetical protein